MSDPAGPSERAVDTAGSVVEEPRQRRRTLRRPKHPIRWIALPTALIMVALVAVVAHDPPATQYEAESPLLGHQEPAISGSTIVPGQPFDLNTLRGQFVVVDFFSSWCVPCRTEQPEFVKFAEHPRDQAVLVGVIFQDSVSAIRAMLGPWIGLYPVLVDPGGQIALQYGVDNPPSKYVIDPEGRVVTKIVGPVTAAGLDAVITQAARRGL